jgi:hypothetical protein
MSTEKNPLDESYPLALYKSLTSGWVMASMYYGEDDTSYHHDMVRISETVDVRFRALQNAEVIRNAVAACDAAEQKAYRELNEKLTKIREQKQQLLALTHQPEDEADHSPYCSYGHKTKAQCDCGPIAENE